ncbi:MAG TPA: hypothetical protein VHW66_03295 [Stellaceae bacterium]|nr:hypothetical protein [Stellaceae bacterium]
MRRILRQWDREVDDERRREAPRPDTGPWRIVSWLALWFLWLAVLALIVAMIRPLHW